ncbi:MAG: DUF2589 domain-containing protein [Desulfobacteraceae bacterium]|nr:DUF2589 domain-containing protein [Desulfobacteraceae bacterium]
MAQQFTGLPMGSLIGAPLQAAARANSMMAMTQTKFLMDTCFKKQKKGDQELYEPITIDLSLTRALIQPESGTSTTTQPAPKVANITTTFRLPLLTILPLNSLAVQTADVEFEMEVKSSYSDEVSHSQQESTDANASFETKIKAWFVSTDIKGSISHKSSSSSSDKSHYQKSNSANYTVKVHAGQLPLPQGVNTIIQAYTNCITPVIMPTSKPS